LAERFEGCAVALFVRFSRVCAVLFDLALVGGNPRFDL
jgi:hypothetical protein